MPPLSILFHSLGEEMPTPDSLIILGICSPAVICLATFSLLVFPPSDIAMQHSSVGPTAYMTLCCIALSFLPEALLSVFSLTTVYGIWQQNAGFLFAAFLGVVGYISLTVIAYKMERNQQEVLTTSRVRYALLIAFLLDLVQGISWIKLFQELHGVRFGDRQGMYIIEMIRVCMPMIRALVLMPLLLLLAIVHFDDDDLLRQGGERQPLLDHDIFYTDDMWWMRRP